MGKKFIQLDYRVSGFDHTFRDCESVRFYIKDLDIIRSVSIYYMGFCMLLNFRCGTLCILQQTIILLHNL